MVPAGIGSWAARFGDVIVAALVVVNAVGDVRNARARSLPQCRQPALPRRRRRTTGRSGAVESEYDARRDRDERGSRRVQLQALAQSGSDALARRITPYGTLFDGDVIFAVSTHTTTPKSPMQVDAIAALVVPEAVERAVRHG